MPISGQDCLIGNYSTSTPRNRSYFGLLWSKGIDRGAPTRLRPRVSRNFKGFWTFCRLHHLNPNPNRKAVSGVSNRREAAEKVKAVTLVML